MSYLRETGRLGKNDDNSFKFVLIDKSLRQNNTHLAGRLSHAIPAKTANSSIATISSCRSVASSPVTLEISNRPASRATESFQKNPFLEHKFTINFPSGLNEGNHVFEQHPQNNCKLLRSTIEFRIPSKYKYHSPDLKH